MISSAQIFRWKNWLKIFFQFQIQRKIFSTKEVLHISGVLKLVNEQKQKLLTFLLLYLANEET